MWNIETLSDETVTLRHGYSVTVRYRISTWFVLFVPVYRKRTVVQVMG